MVEVMDVTRDGIIVSTLRLHFTIYGSKKHTQVQTHDDDDGNDKNVSLETH